LYGRSAAELAGAAFAEACERSTHRKGSLGQVVERLLGASAGSAAGPDFPELGVELKTVPVSLSGAPRESTFVCSIALSESDRLCFETSTLRKKLAHVLWIPVVVDAGPIRFGAPWLWRPTAEQEAVLKADFDDLVGRLACGEAETLSAREGRWLQLRPKAANGRARARTYTAEGEPVLAMPRGFYLRARVTHALFRDPASLSGSELAP
jgi:DNA mismatch repair protein MutH